MKLRTFIILLLSLPLIVFSQEKPQTDNKSALYNIKDYFLLLPDSTLNMSLMERIKTWKAKNSNESWENHNSCLLYTSDAADD